MANKEQKRSSREAKKPKQKKKGAEKRSASKAPRRAYRLRAARENVFMTSPSGLELFPYVQFLRPSQSGRYHYLWNGQNLWRRVHSARGSVDIEIS